jgi:hypothetical protein
MSNLIYVSDLNKEFEIDIKIDYNHLRLLDKLAFDHGLPYGYFKQAIVHTNPKEKLLDRLLEKCEPGGDARSTINTTIIAKCNSTSPGFSYYSCFIFYTDDLDKIKKLFKYYKFRAFT